MNIPIKSVTNILHITLTIFILYSLSLEDNTLRVKTVRGLDPGFQCINTAAKKPTLLNLEDVYKNKPYKNGEIATYKVSYWGIKVGYISLEVKNPEKFNDLWTQRFFATAKTGDWYKYIFKINDTIETFIDADNFSVKKVILHQEHTPAFKSKENNSENVYFDQSNCVVYETKSSDSSDSRTIKYNFNFGSKDVLGLMYYLRTLNYEIGKKNKTMVYSSGLNWNITAMPILKEIIKTPAGEFDAYKIEVTAFDNISKQDGTVFIWIEASNSRPIVAIQIKFQSESVQLMLDSIKYK